MVHLASKVVDAKKGKEDSISLNDVYDPTVDALSYFAGKFCLRILYEVKGNVKV